MAYNAVIQLFDRSGKTQLAGKSTVANHVDWVDLLSFGFSVSASPSPSDRGSARARDVSINYMSQTGVDEVLFKAVTAGTTFEKGILDVLMAPEKGGDKAISFEFRKALVSSFQTSGGGPGEIATVSVTIAYEQLVSIYKSPSKNYTELQGLSLDDWSYDEAAAL